MTAPNAAPPREGRALSIASASSRAGVSRSESSLGKAITAALPRTGAVSVRAFDRVTAAVDASHYLLTPRAVVTPENAEEVAALFAYAADGGVPLTFRSGGTSLSGQASSSNILVDTRKHFRSISVGADGRIVRVGPGERDRLHNRGSCCEQLKRDGLRHQPEHVPDASVSGDRAAERNDCRHRQPGCRRTASCS